MKIRQEEDYLDELTKEISFISSGAKSSFALAMAASVSVQTLEPIFSLPFYPVFRLLGVGTSSIEIAREAVRPSSNVGVDEPLSAVSFSFSLLIILNIFWPILEKGLFFLPLIFVYISLLNLLFIFAPKKKENPRIKKIKKI